MIEVVNLKVLKYDPKNKDWDSIVKKEFCNVKVKETRNGIEKTIRVKPMIENVHTIIDHYKYHVAYNEMKKDIEYTKTTASINADYIEEIKPSISVLCYMHGLGIRSGNENRHNHTLPGKD